MFSRGQNAKDSMGLGSIRSEFISDNHIEVIKIIIAEHPEVIFCGSLGLVINGLLKRPVKDIDILTIDDYYYKPYDFFPEYRVSEIAGSHQFLLGKNNVTSHKLKINDIFIDVLYNDSNILPKYKEFGFYGKKIKVEEPEGAINAKLQYIASDLSDTNFRKHLIDLLEMNIRTDSLIKNIKLSLENLEQHNANLKNIDSIF